MTELRERSQDQRIIRTSVSWAPHKMHMKQALGVHHQGIDQESKNTSKINTSTESMELQPHTPVKRKGTRMLEESPKPSKTPRTTQRKSRKEAPPVESGVSLMIDPEDDDLDHDQGKNTPATILKDKMDKLKSNNKANQDSISSMKSRSNKCSATGALGKQNMHVQPISRNEITKHDNSNESNRNESEGTNTLNISTLQPKQKIHSNSSTKNKRQSVAGRLYLLPSPTSHRKPPLIDNQMYVVETRKAEDERRQAQEELTQMQRGGRNSQKKTRG